MDHIILNIKPFIMQQEILVYKNGNCVKIGKCVMKNVPDAIYALEKSYGINNVDLAGPTAFTHKLRNDMLSMDKYSNFNITVY